MAHVHDPVFHLRPEGGKPGLPLIGITYAQAIEKARQLAQALGKPVHVEGVTTLATLEPR